MMERKNRIDWKRGMEITPRTFMEADNYHIHENQINRQCIIPNSYGLVPQNSFDLKYNIQGNQLILEKMSCVILDISGKTLQLDGGVEVELPRSSQGIFYLVVSLGKEEYFEENGVPYMAQSLQFRVVNLLEVDDSASFPIMKLQANQGDWEVSDFIPPCCAVQSHPFLTQLAKQCKQTLTKILQLTRQQEINEVYYELGGLLVELANEGMDSTPMAFLTIIKKAVFVLNIHNLLEKADSNEVDGFVWGEYNPHALFETIQKALEYFSITIEQLSRPVEKPAPVVEKVKPKEEDEEITYML